MTTGLRRLTGPTGRQVLLALGLAGMWTWWAWLPLWPVTAWSVPHSECDAEINVLSRDGSTIVTVATNRKKVISGIIGMSLGPVRLRDAATGRERVRVLDAQTTVTGAILAPDGSWLLTRDGQDNMVLWDAATGQRRAELWPTGTQSYAGHAWLLLIDGLPFDQSLAVSPDGRVIAAESSRGGAVRLWESATGRPLTTLDAARPPLAFTPDGRALLTAAPGTTAKLWDVATGREILDLPGHPNPVGVVAVSPDGRLLATGLHALRLTHRDKSGPTAVNVWDADTGRRRATLAITEQPELAGSLTFSPDGALLLIGSQLGRGLLWDVTADPPRNRDDLVALTERVDEGVPGLGSTGMTFSPSGRGWWIGGGRSLVRADSIDAAPVVVGLSRSAHAQGRPIFAPDGRTVVCGTSEDPTLAQRAPAWLRHLLRQPRIGDPHGVHVFDAASGRERGTLPTITSLNGYRILGFTPDGQTFWTRRAVETTTEDRWVFEQWRVAPLGTPWLLVGVTAIGVLLAAVDWRRSRGAAIMGAGGRAM
jgi:WD40 repeat protein